MVVHMFRIFVGPPESWSLSACNLAVEDWMSKRSEWQPDPDDHSMIQQATIDGGISWYGGSYRLMFDSEPKDNIFQKLEDKLVNKPDWYRVGYHVCDHDESVRGGCSWDEQREWTATGATIPSEVPAFI